MFNRIVWVGWWFFVCLHSVYSGIDGRVRLDGVWPFIACLCKVCWRTRKEIKDDMKSIWKYLLSTFLIIFITDRSSCQYIHPSEDVSASAHRARNIRLKFNDPLILACEIPNLSSAVCTTRTRFQTSSVSASTSGWQSVYRIPQIFAAFLLSSTEILNLMTIVGYFKTDEGSCRRDLFADIPQSNSAVYHSIKRFVVGKRRLGDCFCK